MPIIKNYMSVRKLDNLVKNTYRKPYNFQQQDDCKERGVYHLTVPAYEEDYPNNVLPEEINGEEMGVSFAAWLARNPSAWNGHPSNEHFVSLFWERHFYPHISMIANDLHARGLLPAGEYIIDID